MRDQSSSQAPLRLVPYSAEREELDLLVFRMVVDDKDLSPNEKETMLARIEAEGDSVVFLGELRYLSAQGALAFERRASTQGESLEFEREWQVDGSLEIEIESDPSFVEGSGRAVRDGSLLEEVHLVSALGDPEPPAPLPRRWNLVAAMTSGVAFLLVVMFLGEQILRPEEIQRLEVGAPEGVEPGIAELGKMDPRITGPQRVEVKGEGRKGRASENVESQVSAEDLIAIIQKMQLEHVHASTGESAQQAFTAVELEAFVGKVQEIVDVLRYDDHFRKVVSAVAELDPQKREELLKRADQPLRRTWANLGEVSPGGQTEAGNKAERLVASSVVKLTKELIGEHLASTRN
jgi:hypothetical protein